MSERFSAQTSHFCSAPPLGCGTSRRFGRLVWASLHLSERSRTIEVRVTTLSPQTCTKSLTQSCLALSVRSISVQLTKCKMCGKNPLKTAYLFDRLREHNIRPRNGQVGKPTKMPTSFFLSAFLSVLAVEASVFCAGANHRPRRSIPLGLSERRGDAPA